LLPYLGEVGQGRASASRDWRVRGRIGGLPIWRRKSKTVTLAYGLLGGAIGLTTGMAWKSRHLSASVAGSAMKNIGKVRDQQWLTKHPIDYA